MTENGDNWDEISRCDYPRDSGDSKHAPCRGLILEMGNAMTGDNLQSRTNRSLVPRLSGTYPGFLHRADQAPL